MLRTDGQADGVGLDALIQKLLISQLAVRRSPGRRSPVQRAAAWFQNSIQTCRFLLSVAVRACLSQTAAHSAEAEVGADERLKDIFHLSALLP